VHQYSDKEKESMRKYLEHAQQKNPMLGYNLKNKGIILTKDSTGSSMEEAFRAMRSSPVCPKCEKPAYRDSRETAVCMACGWRGRTVTIDEYINEKYHRR
jgi:hypothetical protein